MKVTVHPQARAELQEARRWYDERSPLSATAFAHAVDKAVAKILESPTKFPLADHKTRKLRLQRFPFTIFYLLTSSEIVIVAVAHQKRRPGYWSDRMKP